MTKLWAAAACVLLLAGCREGDGPMGGTSGGVLVVRSEPAGGAISVDGSRTGKVTPDTVRGVAGVRIVTVELDSAGIRYGYSAQVVVSGTAVTEVNGPLMVNCVDVASTCARNFHDEHVVGTMRFGSNALGPLFLDDASGGGLHWPAATTNSYLSTGTPMIAGIVNGQPVALGVYDTDFFAGRPAPHATLDAGGNFVLTQRTWIVPPLAAGVPRGIQVDERVAASTALLGGGAVLLVELTFRNISQDSLYRTVDGLPSSGLTYTDTYIGFALDPDIGIADDDWVSYDEARATVYAYDAAFQEQSFGAAANAPGLVGLRVLAAPAGATVLLNGYANSGGTVRDWRAGTFSQSTGYGMLSGTAVYAPDHVSARIGHLPPQSGDVRIMATAGPLTLEPGAEETILLAVAVAPPSTGTFTAGQVVPPGEATDEWRPMYRIAAGLRALLDSAEQLRALLAR